MTAAEYKRRRAALGHTQATLAKIARRETGALPITSEAALALLSVTAPKTPRRSGK
jgi:hypothetical protein